MKETLKGGQTKLDVDKDGKLEKSDFAKLRARKNVKEESDRKPAKKTEREVELPSGAKVKATKVQGWQSQKADKEADKERKAGDKVKESAKPDFPDIDNDGNKKEPIGKAAKDKKVKETAISGAPQKSGIPATAKTTVPGMRANQQDLKKANSSAALGEGKCNHTPKGKSCPIHGLKECSTLKEGYTLQKTNLS